MNEYWFNDEAVVQMKSFNLIFYTEVERDWKIRIRKASLNRLELALDNSKATQA